MDIFIHLLYFCPPKPRLGAIVCWNAGKVYAVPASPPYLIPPLLVGLAVAKKFVLTLLFPKAGAGGGLLAFERGPVQGQSPNHYH